MPEIKVWLGGEGNCELGTRADGGDSVGVVEALLRKLEPLGWHVEGATKWQHIRKFRVGAAIRRSGHGDTRNARALALIAFEAGCEVLALSAMWTRILSVQRRSRVASQTHKPTIRWCESSVDAHDPRSRGGSSRCPGYRTAMRCPVLGHSTSCARAPSMRRAMSRMSRSSTLRPSKQFRMAASRSRHGWMMRAPSFEPQCMGRRRR